MPVTRCLLQAENANGNISRWVRSAGEIELGGAAELWDLAYKLPTNLVRPGMTFYVQLEAMLASGSPPPANLQFFAGFFRQYGGTEKITFTAAILRLRVRFSATSRELIRLIIWSSPETDSGEVAISNVLSLPNAPAVFTQSNHPRISVQRCAGLYPLRYLQIFQRGSMFCSLFYKTRLIRLISTWAIRRCASKPHFLPQLRLRLAPTREPEHLRPGAIGGANFVRHIMTITVPTTYDRTNTAPDSQWLRIGLTNLTDENRQIVIRRIGLFAGVTGSGRGPPTIRERTRTRHRVQIRHHQARAISGGGIYNPPPGGSGYCALVTSLFNILENNGKNC